MKQNLGQVIKDIYHKIECLIAKVNTMNSGGGDSRPYTSYTALLNQVGGNAPTATILENTANLNVQFVHSQAGWYQTNITPVLDLTKTTVILGNTFNYSEIMPCLINYTTGGFQIVLEADDNNAFDGTLNNTMLEIRVYN